MTLKRAMLIASAFCVALYVFPYWCEAMYNVGEFGYKEVISWSRFTDAFWRVSLTDFVKVWPPNSWGLFDILMLGGAVLTATLAFKIRYAAKVLTVYGVVLLLPCGGAGILVLLGMLLPPYCTRGEFFADRWVVFHILGIWTITVIILTCAAWKQKRQNACDR